MRRIEGSRFIVIERYPRNDPRRCCPTYLVNPNVNLPELELALGLFGACEVEVGTFRNGFFMIHEY